MILNITTSGLVPLGADPPPSLEYVNILERGGGGDSLIKLFPAILDMITGTKTSHHDLNIVGYRCATCAFTKGCVRQVAIISPVLGMRTLNVY